MNWRAGDCCCGECEYFADSFLRDDNVDPGINWEEVAGGAEINANHLRVTSSNAVIACTIATPTGVQLAKATIRAGSTGDRGRVIVRYTDANNFLFAEVQFGTTDSTLRLYRRNSGTDTLLATSTLLLLNSSDPCTLKVCFYGNTLTAQAYENTTFLKGTLAAFVSTIPSGFRAGVGTGAITSFMTFDDFELLKHNEAGETECDECSPQCGCCDVAYQPFREYVVDLGAGGLGNSACSSCSAINGEWHVVASGSGPTCAFSYCQSNWCSFVNDAISGVCGQAHSFGVSLGHACSGFPTLTSAKWRVTISISFGACGVSDPACTFSRSAVYESAELISDAQRCQTLPVELFKISDTFDDAAGSGQQVCTGSLPSSIWLRSP